MKLIVLILTLCVLSPVWANTERVVTSVHDGQSPYLMVSVDTEGSSKREPGIYVMDSEGKWHKRFSGKLLQGGSKLGIFQQLSLTQLDRRYESIAVIDGKIHLIQIHSKQEDPKSYIQLGSEGHPLSDLNHLPVSLPPVERFEDLEFWAGEHTPEGQLVLFSVRIKGQGPIGDGITFAAFLKKAGSDPQKLELAHDPIVIDYKFQNFQQLGALVKKYGPQMNAGVFSRLLLLANAKKNANKDPSHPQEAWKENIRKTLKQLDQGQAPRDESSIPFINMETGRIELETYPEIHHTVGRINLVQVFDPLFHKHGVILDVGSQQTADTSKYAIFGKIDSKADGNSFHVYPAAGQDQIGLTYVNGEPYLLFQNTSSGKTFALKLDKAWDTAPDEVSVAARTFERDHSIEHYVFISSKAGNQGKTEVIQISETGKTQNLSKQTKILGEYVKLDELQARMQIPGANQDSSLAKEVLFDAITPVQGSAQSYSLARDLTIPFLDIVKTATEGTALQRYIKAVEEKELINNQIYYRLFNSRGADVTQNGIYLIDREGKEVAVVKGEILSPPIADGKYVGSDEGYPLFRHTISLGEDKLTSAQLSGYALDPTGKKGDAGFILVLASTFTGESRSDYYFPPVRYELPISLPFKQISRIELVRGFAKNKNSVFLLINLKKADGYFSNQANGGLSLISFTLNLDEKAKPQQFSFGNLQNRWISTTSMPDRELSSHLRADHEGNVYWAASLSTDEDDTKTDLVKLATGQVSPLSSWLSRGARMLSTSDSLKAIFGESSDEYSYGVRLDDWEFRGPVTLKAGVGTAVNDEKVVEKAKSYFPGLTETMNRLTQAKNPTSREVFLVASDLKEHFVQALVSYFTEATRTKGYDYRIGQEAPTRFYAFDPARAVQESILGNLDALRDTRENSRNFLYADAENILKDPRPQPSQPNKGDARVLKDPSLPPSEQKAFHPHVLYLLATEGLPISLEQMGKSPPSTKGRFSQMIVATPEEWKKLQAQLDPEAKFGVLKNFKINTNYLSSSWKVWAPNTPKMSPETKKYREEPVSEVEKEVFPELTQTLEQLSDTENAPKHKLLLVPSNLKPYIKKLLLSIWATPNPVLKSWTYKNTKMDLYRLASSKELTQEAVFENYDAMRELKDDRRATLIAELEDMVAAGRVAPKSQSHAFKIQDIAQPNLESEAPTSAPEADGEETEEEDVDGEDPAGTPKKSIDYPHILYYLATEGEKIQPHEFEKLKDQPKRVSTLLIGSPEEWEELKREMHLEARFDLASQFEVMKLDPPSPEIRKKLLNKILQRPEIDNLNYSFDLGKNNPQGKPYTPQEAKDKLLGYMINRTEQLALQFNRESTSEFIRVLDEFSRMLIEEPTVRTKRVIDQTAIERLLSKTFGIALNLKILPTDDPLILLNREDAPLLLQNAGYPGPLELKSHIISTILSQTRTDPVRTVPSSIILFGDTGTGKTQLFKSLVEMQGLKYYDFSDPLKNTNAQAIIINVGALTSAKTSEEKQQQQKESAEGATGEVMHVDEAIRHLNHFLTLNMGYRGMILFDDAHKGDEPTIEKLLTFINSVHSAPNGQYKAKNWKSQVRTISVRNLTMVMTLNPTQDQEKIRRFTVQSTKPDDVALVCATLSTKNKSLERSDLERWGFIANLSVFPPGAKGPKLLESLRDSARNDFNIQGRFVIVAPTAVTAVVNQFPNANAREFLSVTTNQLLQRTMDAVAESPIYVVVPKANASVPGRSWEATGRSATEMENFIRTNTTAIPVAQRYDGQLHFLSVVLDSFRTHVYDTLIFGAGRDTRLAGGRGQLTALLAPFLHAITSNLTLSSYLPLNALHLDPFDFNAVKPADQREFRRVLESLSGDIRKYFPVKFLDEFRAGTALDELLNPTMATARQKNRAGVLSEYTERLVPILTAHLKSALSLKSLSDFPSTEEWLRSLPDQDRFASRDETAQKLMDALMDFYREIYSPSLVENLKPENFAPMSNYDASRLFLLALDRAMTKISWGKLSQFMIKGISYAASDMDIGQLPGVQHYLFKSKLSLVKPASHELILQTASSSQAFRDWNEEFKKKNEEGFGNKCERLLVQE